MLYDSDINSFEAYKPLIDRRLYFHARNCSVWSGSVLINLSKKKDTKQLYGSSKEVSMRAEQFYDESVKLDERHACIFFIKKPVRIYAHSTVFSLVGIFRISI